MPLQRCVFCEGVGHKLLGLGYFIFSHAACYRGPTLADFTPTDAFDAMRHRYFAEFHPRLPCPCALCRYDRAVKRHSNLRERLVRRAREQVVENGMRGGLVHDLVVCAEDLEDGREVS